MLSYLLQADPVEAVQEVAQAAPVQQVMSYSLIDMAVKGGPLMIVLLVLSVIALYIFGKKLWMIRQASRIDKDFMMDIRDYIHDGKLRSAKTLCSKFDTPVARMVETGIDRIGKPLGDIQSAVENVGNVEVARLEKGLPYLAMIAGGAPMIGFLGTVIGMVQAFFNMSQAGNNIDITLLSSGIYTAMITTVGGLIVGIIAYFGYNYLTSKVSNVVFQMESSTIEFMDLLEEPVEPAKAED
jgi:biopolymer transport protein ExbB